MQISDHSLLTFSKAPQQELTEASALFDVAEHRLHRLHPQSLALPTPLGQ